MRHFSNFLFISLCLCDVGITQAQTFPYPTIPQELRTPQERGSYLLEHYWDNYDFTDTTLIHQPDITEQGFSNFIDLLPRFDSIAAVKGVEAFAWRAFGANVPQNMRSHLASLADHYLYDPNSPMRSDVLYTMFLKTMVTSPAFSNAEQERFAYQLTNLSKNLPGTVATDFAYIDRKGQKSSLYSTRGETIVIYFNDPDCDNCHAVTAMLSGDSLLTCDASVKVLAIYPDADTDQWRTLPQPFPPTWTDAYSPDGEITAKQLYFIRATPTIYVLDKDKRVVLKDCTPQALHDYLAERYQKQKEEEK